MREIATSVLLLFGVGFILTAAIGVLRLPDVLCRAHAVAKAVTMGIFQMLLAFWIYIGADAVGLKIILAIFFQLVTIPLSSHLVALLAFQKDIPRWRKRPMDEGLDRRGG
jgi:multicomponent Na+:H+ antiporter subunit G